MSESGNVLPATLCVSDLIYMLRLSHCALAHNRSMQLATQISSYYIVFVILFVVVHVIGLSSKSNYSLAISVFNPDLAVGINSIDFSQGLIFKFFSARAKWNLRYTGEKKLYENFQPRGKPGECIIRLHSLREYCITKRNALYEWNKE